MLRAFVLALVAVVALAPIVLAPTARAAELVFITAPGCHYCEQWKREVGEGYHNSSEGKIAPLTTVEKGELPRRLKFIKGIVYTPTFVLVHKGKEIGRINGYPGGHFWWPMLAELIEKLPDDARLKPAG